MTTQQKTVAIIGAGIVGVSTAIWLLRDGHKVILIDRDGTDNDACQVGESCTSDCQCAFAIPVPEEPHEEVPQIPPQDAF